MLAASIVFQAAIKRISLELNFMTPYARKIKLHVASLLFKFMNKLYVYQVNIYSFIYSNENWGNNTLSILFQHVERI